MPRRAPAPDTAAAPAARYRFWRRWSLGTQMLGGFAVPVLIVVLASFYVADSIRAMREASFVQDEASEALALRNRMLNAVLDAETSVRGFLVTGDVVHLDAYRLAATDLHAAVARLRQTDATEPDHLARVLAVRDLFERWRREFAEPAIGTRPADSRAGALGPAAGVVESGRGAGLVALMRLQLQRSQREEEREREEALVRSRAIAERARWVALLVPTAALLAGLAATLLILLDALRGIRAVNRAAQGVAAGDLGRRMRVLRGDEIGRLGTTFNRMAVDLDDRRRRSDAIVRFQRLLTTSQTRDELLAVTREACQQVFPPAAAAVYLMDAGSDRARCVAAWGCPGDAPVGTLGAAQCRALQDLRAHYSDGTPHAVRCAHVEAAPWPVGRSLCVPLSAQGVALGALHLFMPGEDQAGPLSRRDMDTAVLIADQLALAIHGLALRESLREQAMHDALTGLYNRRSLDELLDLHLAKARRDGSVTSIALVDVDHFKHVNDRFGHDAGDALLIALARLLAQSVRAGDVVGRHGGEEFVLVMPNTSPADALARAEQLRRAVEHAAPGGRAVTVSIGVASSVGGRGSRDDMLKQADLRLYEAKAAGRNRAVGEAIAAALDAPR